MTDQNFEWNASKMKKNAIAICYVSHEMFLNLLGLKSDFIAWLNCGQLHPSPSSRFHVILILQDIQD